MWNRDQRVESQIHSPKGYYFVTSLSLHYKRSPLDLESNVFKDLPNSKIP